MKNVKILLAILFAGVPLAFAGINFASGQSFFNSGALSLPSVLASETEADDGEDGDCVKDDDKDGIEDAADTDDDNDGIADATDTDDDNDGTPDTEDKDDDGKCTTPNPAPATSGAPAPTANAGGNNPVPPPPPAVPAKTMSVGIGACASSCINTCSGTAKVASANEGEDEAAGDDNDCDNDGQDDVSDTDDDNDGIADAVDIDDDNDGVKDTEDADDDDKCGCDVDQDNDGQDDASDTDDDNDGIADTADTDDDNDGVTDDKDDDDSGNCTVAPAPSSSLSPSTSLAPSTPAAPVSPASQQCVADCNKSCLEAVGGNVQNTCSNLLVDPGQIPSQLNSYSAPFAKSNKSLQMGVFCDTNSAKLYIGDDAPTTYIHPTAHTATSKGQWTPITLTGKAAEKNIWLQGSAQANLPVSATSPGEYHFVIAYICHWEGNVWSCGCSDSKCDSKKWNIQAFMKK